MSNKEARSLDNLHAFFSQKTQSALILIEKLLHLYQRESNDLNDLFYFGCIFLGLLASRLEPEEKLHFKHNMRDILNTAAQDGVIMCEGIISASLSTQENRDQVMKQLMLSLRGTGSPDSSILPGIANDLHLLNTKSDSVLKNQNQAPYTQDTEERVQSALEKFIDLVLSQVDVPQDDTRLNPDLLFLTTAIINIGLIGGCISVLYKQSLEELITAGINKLNTVITFDSKDKMLLH